MKEKRLLKALGQVDADYIEEASPTKQAKRPHWMKWGAIAACLVLICVATIHFPLAPTPGGTSTTTNTGTTTGNISGEGDQDVDMTSEELISAMLDAGYTQAEVDEYQSIGYQMTWAKWWKFHRQSEESGDRTLEALLDFSREEGLAVNTGEAPELPGGAYVSDQGEAIMAYQNLMDRFKADYGPDKYPEWYGGAYIDERAGLVVNIAQGYEPEGKELFFQIQEWAGSDRVSFGSSRESLNYLRFLQDRALAAMEELGLAAGCGINEETGMVELTLPEADEEALWQLARLDPANSILVIVAQTAATDGLAEEPVQEAPSVSHIIQPGGTPEVPDNAIVDEDGVLAWEPQN